jgi:hypothetical protein
MPMNKLRTHLTYANVMSTLAVFMLLAGGGAYAAKKLKLKNNSVTTPKLRDAAVTSGKLADGSVTTSKLGAAAVTDGKIATRTITGGKIANDTITGNEIDERTIKTPCATPAVYFTQLGECFYFTNPGGANGIDWNTAITTCRASSVGATLATTAQLAAWSGLGGNPYTGKSAWASEVEQGGAAPQVHFVSFDNNGVIQPAMPIEPLTMAVGNVGAACAYVPDPHVFSH